MTEGTHLPKGITLAELERRRQTLDTERMYEVLQHFPQQIQQALTIADSVPIRDQGVQFIDTIIIGGMGGSAIGGAVLRDLLYTTEGLQHFEIHVHRNYDRPPICSERTLGVAISYSGNTEETLSFAEAIRTRIRHLICITSDGKLAQFARQHNYPLILVPSGYQPRCAFGFLFFTLLRMLMRYKIFPQRIEQRLNRAIEETQQRLQSLSTEYSALTAHNPALQLASKLYGKIPVIYSSASYGAALNARWRAQIQENAKQLAFGNLLPEMNHNEINGWQHPPAVLQNLVPIFLKDPEDHPRIQIRMAISAEILQQYVPEVLTFEGEGNSVLVRLISLMYFGDWVSYWLALLNGVDPSPVPIIQELKKQLDRFSS